MIIIDLFEEKEGKEKEGGKGEIVNGIYMLIEWRFVLI